MTELDTADIRWRVSNTWDKGDKKMGMLVGYIDSRTAMDALDALDANWSSKMEPITLAGESGIRCTLIVNGVAREDVGVVSNIDALKGAFSDALKRAAVHFGIGRELYELPKIAVECEVGSTGKVKAPKALPTFRNGRWEIDRQFGWVKYEREPNDASEQRGGAKPSSPRAAPAQPSRYRRGELQELMAEQGLDNDAVETFAMLAGVPKNERPMSDASMDRLIDAIRESTVIDPPVARAGVPDGVPTDPADVVASEAAPPASDAPPPKPGSDAYRLLPSGVERAAAKSYWEAHPEPDEPSLAEQLQVPA